MNKLEQAARQALEALEVYEIKLNSRLCNEAITALREALANTRSSIRSTSEYSEQAEQEPAAWVDEDGFPWKYNLDGKDWVPLYAAPVRTKDLTDDEIKAAYESWWDTHGNHAFPIWVGAKAVIAAYKEKNK